MRLLIFAALVALGWAQSDEEEPDCLGDMKTCLMRGFPDDCESPIVSKWRDTVWERVFFDMQACSYRYRCVKDLECMMDAALEYKQGVDTCSDMANFWLGLDEDKKFEIKAIKILKTAADPLKCAAMAQAFCHPDDARKAAKCFKKAVAPAFLLEGNKFFHAMVRKKRCIKGASSECKKQYKDMVDGNCACVADLSKPEHQQAMRDYITGKCPNVFPEGVDGARIAQYFRFKKCINKKEKMCKKKAMPCLMADAPKSMKKWMKQPDLKKVKSAHKIMGPIIVKAASCFEKFECVKDLECAMKAGMKFKLKVPECMPLVHRYAGMDKMEREAYKIKMFAKMVFDAEMGEPIFKAMCKKESDGEELRDCLKNAFGSSPKAAMRRIFEKGTELFKTGITKCLPKATKECQDLWAAKWEDKCECVKAMASRASELKTLVAKKCSPDTMPADDTVAKVFEVKQTLICAASDSFKRV